MVARKKISQPRPREREVQPYNPRLDLGPPRPEDTRKKKRFG